MIKQSDMRQLLESLEHSGGGDGYPNSLCAKAATALRDILNERNQWAWLIEAPGQNYLGVRNLSSMCQFIWTQDHDAALQFRSEEQADLMMTALRCANRELFGFDLTLGPARAVEHGWIAAPTGQSKP